VLIRLLHGLDYAGSVIIITLADTSGSYTYLGCDVFMFVPLVGMCGAPVYIELSNILSINSNYRENRKTESLSSGLLG
jgi:hypothetical protein